MAFDPNYVQKTLGIVATGDMWQTFDTPQLLGQVAKGLESRLGLTMNIRFMFGGLVNVFGEEIPVREENLIELKKLNPDYLTLDDLNSDSLVIVNHGPNGYKGGIKLKERTGARIILAYDLNHKTSLKQLSIAGFPLNPKEQLSFITYEQADEFVFGRGKLIDYLTALSMLKQVTK